MFSAGVTSTYERFGLPSAASSSAYSCFISPSQTSKHLQMSKQSPSFMAHTLGTLAHCSLPRERLGKKAAGTWPLHACLHQPSTRLSGPLPSSSALWSSPKSQNSKPFFFSGSCQGYSGWYVKDVGLLAILGRQEPGGPCRRHEASRQGDCGRPGPLWVTSAVVQVPWRTKPR